MERMEMDGNGEIEIGDISCRENETSNSGIEEIE